MSWAFVRPADARLLASQPLLDLGTGDGQTISALVDTLDGIVGIDRAFAPLRTADPAITRVCGDADALPFKTGRFATVLAADLLHHLDDEALLAVLTEARRVLRPGGSLVAWWYSRPGRPAPDAPRYPRPLADVARMGAEAGFATHDEIELVTTLEPAPATTGAVLRV